ncbi:hypothetical protein BC938DRAFT_473625 [Jimgerdemannia flammicorona]|uniref:Uncharacterized protein n=1 Tax=Jimgerdemannia flammicorona TaxID=994334 RepID=A0A433QT63_9FUNG|nr:hypothetical protein BC938DRAFT_473625 [Jimgerdemannia flammicorona]
MKRLKDAYLDAKQNKASTDPIWWRVVDMTTTSIRWRPSQSWLENTRKTIRGRIPDNISEMAKIFIAALYQLPLAELQKVARDYKQIGSKGILRNLSTTEVPVKASAKDRLQAMVCDMSPAPSPPCLEVNAVDPSAAEIIWILDCLSEIYTNTERGIPQRRNTERDIDIFYNRCLFRIVEDVVDVHFGEMCSRASRERRQVAVDRAKINEGSKLDWLFSRHDLGPAYYWGQEFGIVENAGTKCDNKRKVSKDSLRTMKNLRDMLLSIRKRFPVPGESSILDEAFKQLVLPGIVMSSWTYRIIAVSPIDDTWHGLIDVDKFILPTTMNELQQVLKCCRSMLLVREILKKTIQIMRLAAEVVDEDGFVPCENQGSPEEQRTPKKKKQGSKAPAKVGKNV